MSVISKTYALENASTILTLATGAVTATQGNHIVAAESGTADDLDTINRNFTDIPSTYYPFLMIKADTGDTITVKHNTGNIYLYSLADVTLTGEQTLFLWWNGTKWVNSA